MAASIRIVNSLAHEKWLKFIEKHPSANVFHTPLMMEVFKATKNCKPFLFAAVNEKDGNIESLISANRVTIISGVLSELSSRMISYGGVVAGKDMNSGIGELMRHYDNVAKSKSLFSEIRNMDTTEPFRKDILKAGYEYIDYLNYVIDLRREPATIFRQFSKGRRSGIKALEKKGVVVKEVGERKDIEKIYELLDQTYSRIEVPIPDISLFESAMEHLQDKGMARFYLAVLKGEYLASLVALIYKGVILTWYYGSNLEFRHLSAESLLIWHVIQWGAASGCRWLDFGGAGRPEEEYSVRDFKARFHGDLTNHGRYIKVYHPKALKLAKAGYEIYRRLL